jgi:hypothetical protein
VPIYEGGTLKCPRFRTWDQGKRASDELFFKVGIQTNKAKLDVY